MKLAEQCLRCSDAVGVDAFISLRSCCPVLATSQVHMLIGQTRLAACSLAVKSVPDEQSHVDLDLHGAHPYDDPRQRHRPEG